MSDILIDTQVRDTIQSDRKKENNVYPLLHYMYAMSEIVPAWWSMARDIELRKLWKKSDHLSGAMYSIASKMVSIPFRVVARDQSIKEHVRIADQYTLLINDAVEFGDGWETFFSKFTEAFVGSDNGVFVEIIGGGSKDGEIQGSAISMSVLDQTRCYRTGNPLYPVRYVDTDGTNYKLHYTRVMFFSQMPSTDSRMYGVGFCSVSRALYAAQNLIDISVYKQEKMGSRPPRQLMLTGGGLDPEDLETAIMMANSSMTQDGYSRFAKTIAIGNKLLEKPTIEMIDLISIPDGFDEKWSTISGMAIIALAFGLDARELFPAMADASKSDAVIQHIKQRGKAPGHIISIAERGINQKFLPPFLKMVFDYQDDSQDRQVAEIRGVRSVTRERNVATKITDVRTERENMLRDGEITQEQFEQLELNDGRLGDGTCIDILFHSTDPELSLWLSNTTDANYEEKEDAISNFIANSNSARKIKKARQALAAIKYKFDDKEEDIADNMQQNVTEIKPKPEDTSYDDGEKLDNKLPKSELNNDSISRFKRTAESRIE